MREEITEFENIYKRFYRKAFLFTKSYVHDKVVAEDITSESLIKLWEQIRRQQVIHPEGFLLTLLKNKALDFLKHETIKKEAFNEMKMIHREELNLRISLLEACDPEEIFTTEIQKIIQKTLSQFPEQTRLIFELSRFENKSNKEIAEKLGLSAKSIEYHISKVLKALRISLRDYLPLFYFFFFYH
jgi:RNA polymerase sigma-70 factor (ECF subfamily)